MSYGPRRQAKSGTALEACESATEPPLLCTGILPRPQFILEALGAQDFQKNVCYMFGGLRGPGNHTP
eukprot:7695643-Pyramimonas_sp.AAC.1